MGTACISEDLKPQKASSICELLARRQLYRQVADRQPLRYRLTGDKKWQEKGWRMFTSWMDSCTAGAGFSSVSDVSVYPPRLADNMVSPGFHLKFHRSRLMSEFMQESFGESRCWPDIQLAGDVPRSFDSHTMVSCACLPGSIC